MMLSKLLPCACHAASAHELLTVPSPSLLSGAIFTQSGTQPSIISVSAEEDWPESMSCLTQPLIREACICLPSLPSLGHMIRCFTSSPNLPAQCWVEIDQCNVVPAFAQFKTY